MNLAQIARQARLEIDAIRASGTTSGLWIDEEVYAAINTALDSAYRIVRLSGSDLLAKHLKSTDSAVDLITESYDPGSLQLVSGTIDYTLPPDLVERLRPGLSAEAEVDTRDIDLPSRAP